MKKIGYFTQAIILLVYVFIVIAIFKVIGDRQVAGLVAGSGFLTVAVLFLVNELRGNKNKIHIGLLLAFLVASALPMFLMRIFNWGIEFDQLSLMGIPMTVVHKYSNYLYIMLILSAGYCWYVEKTKKASS